MLIVTDTHNIQKLLNNITVGPSPNFRLCIILSWELCVGWYPAPSRLFHRLLEPDVVLEPMRDILNGCAYKPEL
jgi:hypothetical protein